MLPYPDSVRFLYALGNEIKTAKLGLDRIRLVLTALDNPQDSFRSIHVAGTNGKGSTCAMIDAGLAIVLATDFNPGSSPIASMPVVLSLACTQMKMTPAETITAATINAAWSLNLGHEVGSLEPGKSADFVVHEANDYRELPYFLGTQRPAMVFAQGERVA